MDGGKFMKKKFLAVYIGTPSSADNKWANLTEAEKKKRAEEGMKAWGAWTHKYASVIKDMGAPLGKTKRVDEKGVSDTKNALTAYTLIEADSHEEAAKIFLNHPHFTIFPGDSVEIVECLPMPT